LKPVRGNYDHSTRECAPFFLPFYVHLLPDPFRSISSGLFVVRNRLLFYCYLSCHICCFALFYVRRSWLPTKRASACLLFPPRGLLAQLFIIFPWFIDLCRVLNESVQITFIVKFFFVSRWLLWHLIFDVSKIFTSPGNAASCLANVVCIPNLRFDLINAKLFQWITFVVWFFNKVNKFTSVRMH
jgi:hypothetical protein